MRKEERRLKKALRLKKQKRYLRCGECIQCGDCCENEGPDGGPCEYFLRVDPDKGICTVFGQPERYDRCPKYPENPPITYMRCSYYFQDLHNGSNRVIMPGDRMD